MKSQEKKLRELSPRQLRAVSGGLIEGSASDPGTQLSKLEGGSEKPMTATLKADGKEAFYATV
jgi:hypothetical protein